MPLNYVIIDLETTGFNPASEKIIEIAAVKINEAGILGEFSQLIDPGQVIPEEITRLTGINNEMVAGEPNLTAILTQLETFLADSVLVAHNAGFDRGFIGPYLSREYNWLDSLELAKIFLPLESGFSLTHLAEALQLELGQAHRALADARATAGLFLRLLDMIDQTKTWQLEILASLHFGAADFIGSWLQEIYGQRTRSFSSEKIKTRSLFTNESAGEEGLFSTSEKRESDSDFRLAVGDIKRLFHPEGTCAQNFSSYEFRPQQLEMSEAVADSLNGGGHLVVEAGTGTGKSMAYLLPAILWAVGSGCKVVISTHTLNLQEQLLTKDIPLAREILAIDFRAAVVKGRGHYLCIRKWETLFADSRPEQRQFMRRLVLWLAATATGDCHEISFNKKESRDWQWLSAAGETCMGIKCPHFRGRCFVSRARKRAEGAQVLVANHSLLLANALLDENVLPEYHHLIIDEAHQLENVAEDQFGSGISFPRVNLLLNRIKRSETGGLYGFLDGLGQKIDGIPGIAEDDKKRIKRLVEAAGEALTGCFSANREYFAALKDYFNRLPSQGTAALRTVRITETHRSLPAWENLVTAGDNLLFNFKGVFGIMLQLSGEARFLETEWEVEFPGANELNFLLAGIKENVDYMEKFLSGGDENDVTWIEGGSEGFFPLLKTAPLEVSHLLQRYLFANKSVVVMTSATLAVKGGFDFFTERVGIGLGETAVKTMLLESPFHYQDSVLLGAASDLPDPARTPELLFSQAVAGALIKLICASQGRTLVLFTSHQQLRQVYEIIRRPLAEEGITVFAHGVSGNRGRLLEQFKNNAASVILGANSFWEGVDVVGEALSSVIIVKLPFWPPTMPTLAARLERMKAEGLDGFTGYSLPQAVIRFKQGFGRLIRSTDDFGSVCILDRRIYEKKYGSIFLRSLPNLKLVIQETDELAEAVNGWLAHKKFAG